MNNLKKVFLGSKDIGLECLIYLYLKQLEHNYEIIGVLTNTRGEKIKYFSNEKDL